MICPWRASLLVIDSVLERETTKILQGRTHKFFMCLFGRKALTFLVLVCFCAAVVPIPLPSSDFLNKNDSQPFPCKNSSCGCKTAEQCWRSCCCLSLAERLAWAEKNGVSPPSYLLVPAKIDSRTMQKTASDPVANSLNKRSKCCSNCKSCCERSKAKGKLVQGGSRESGDIRRVAESKESVSKSRGKTVVCLFALKCQGKSSAFHQLPWTIYSVPQDLILFDQQLGPVHLLSNPIPLPVHLEPDPPPPKLMHS